MLSPKDIYIVVTGIAFVLSFCQDIFRYYLFDTSRKVIEIDDLQENVIGVYFYALLSMISVCSTIIYFNQYWKSRLQKIYLNLKINCNCWNICSFICIIVCTISIPFWIITCLTYSCLIVMPSCAIHYFYFFKIILKWSSWRWYIWGGICCLCPENRQQSAYNLRLFEYITRDNKYYNFEQAQNKIIAINYYILSVIKDKINNYQTEQQKRDNRFLQKVSDLHENSRFYYYTNNKTKYLWNVNWSYFSEQSRCDQVLEIFIWFSYFLYFLYCIGLIVYAYCIHYDGIIVLSLYFLLEIMNIISIVFHQRIFNISFRLLPNLNNDYFKSGRNRKLKLMWDALDVPEDEMIRRIQIVYDIMFKKPLNADIDAAMVDRDIAGIISQYLWYPLPYTLETGHKLNDMNEVYAIISSTETDPDYLSFVFDEESESDDYNIIDISFSTTSSSSQDQLYWNTTDRLDTHFMET